MFTLTLKLIRLNYMKSIKDQIAEIRAKYEVGSYESKKSRDEKMKLIGVWVPNEAKEKYDKLQKDTKQTFSKDTQDLLLTTIDIAYKSRYP